MPKISRNALPLLLLSVMTSFSISCQSMRPGLDAQHQLAEPQYGTAEEVAFLASHVCTQWEPRKPGNAGTAPLLREYLGRIYLQHYVEEVEDMREDARDGTDPR